MDVDGDQHDANIEPEIESSEMQDRGGADFGFHYLLIHNNNCEGHDKSDEDSFDSDDGFCSGDDDASLFDKWEYKEDLDVSNQDGDDSDCELEEDGANDSGAATTTTRSNDSGAATTATTKGAVAMRTSATAAVTTAAARTNATAVGAQYCQHWHQHQQQQHQLQQQQ